MSEDGNWRNLNWRIFTLLPKNINELNILNEERKKVLGEGEDFTYEFSSKAAGGWGKKEGEESKEGEEIEEFIFSIYWDIVKNVMATRTPAGISLPKKEDIKAYLEKFLSESSVTATFLKSDQLNQFKRWSFNRDSPSGPGMFLVEATKAFQIEEMTENAASIDVFDSVADYCSVKKEEATKILYRLQKTCENYEKKTDNKIKIAEGKVLKRATLPGYRTLLKEAKKCCENGGRKRKRKTKRKTGRKRKTRRKKRTKKKTRKRRKLKRKKRTKKKTRKVSRIQK